MNTSVQSDRYALCLAADAYIDSSPVTGLSTLEWSGASIPLSESAAVILKLCNGRNRVRDIVSHLRLRGRSDQFLNVHAFIDAACRRRWVTQVELPRSDKMSKVEPCVKYM